MKRLQNLSLLLFVFVAFVGCNIINNDIIMDYYPVCIHIYVHDTDGNNLLDTTRHSSIYKDITITYKDKTYSINPWRTRAYYAEFIAPYIENWQGSGLASNGYRIVVGEWAGDENWDESFTINWPDGTHSLVSFSLHKRGYTNAKYFLDGKPHSSSSFFFTYPSK